MQSYSWVVNIMVHCYVGYVLEVTIMNFPLNIEHLTDPQIIFLPQQQAKSTLSSCSNGGWTYGATELQLKIHKHNGF